MSLLIPKKKRRRYGDVKPKPPPTRGFEWLSPRTKEAQRFIRAPELQPIGNRWGGRSLGQYAVSAGIVTPFMANPPSFAPQAPAAQVPTVAGGGAQPSAQTGAGPVVAPGLAGTRTFTAGGRTYTQAPTPFVTSSVPKVGGRPATSAGPIR